MTHSSRLPSPAAAIDRVAFPALGTTAVLLTADPAGTASAVAALKAELVAIDDACSRFRPDTELSRVNASAGSGRPVPVGPLLAEALEVALRAARLTDGVVDPTVGPAAVALGYDVTFTRVARTGPTPALHPAKGWQTVGWDPELRLLRLPPGSALDLGATAKALAADRAARAAAAAARCGVLVNLGGDLSTAGPAPAGGWRVAVADDHAEPAGPGLPVVALSSGGLATSGTTVRTWERGGRTRHHIIDPATGDSAPAVWRTASVTAADCVDANTASTAAIVMGERAVDWLRDTGLPARLVRADGGVVRLNGWPPEDRPAPEGTRI
ncbi:FAD:protein FMN transferase [Actinacidiphila acidipaludis]|uniref:FAD:protein FMN transferase n=1 Tax=Actinacidiphila acidipaludis TaxID=2873382 RepID=A0ABS7PZC7_9ACTN|nr:FAD:protein FMN transferase [Streptomyces acidipaludis]MBY8876233.1 FAD:protein FMN transferase [Streptomyces acidipaludis]